MDGPETMLWGALTLVCPGGVDRLCLESWIVQCTSFCKFVVYCLLGCVGVSLRSSRCAMCLLAVCRAKKI